MVSLSVVAVDRPLDVRGEGRPADLVDHPVDILPARGFQRDHSPSVKLSREDLQTKLMIALAKHYARPFLQLLTGMHEDVPPGLVEALEQKTLDLPAAGFTSPKKPGRKDAGVVDDEQVIRSQQIGQLVNSVVRARPRGAIELEETCVVPDRCSLLSNELRRQVEIKRRERGRQRRR